MISAEALFNGSRWRLQVKDDGTWTIANRKGRTWDEHFTGDGGLTGLREAAKGLRSFADITGTQRVGAELLDALADVAESGRAA